MRYMAMDMPFPMRGYSHETADSFPFTLQEPEPFPSWGAARYFLEYSGSDPGSRAFCAGSNRIYFHPGRFVFGRGNLLPYKGDMMRQAQLHDNQIAIDVKGEPSLTVTEAQEEWIKANPDYYDLLWAEGVEAHRKAIETMLRKRYPSFDVRINIVGRSGGWVELTGNFGPVYYNKGGYFIPDNYSHARFYDAVGDEYKHKARLLNDYIVPRFERLVSVGLTSFKAYMENSIRDLAGGGE